MSQGVHAIVFECGVPTSAINRIMLPTRKAASLDVIEKLLSLPEYFCRVTLASNYADLLAEASKMGAMAVEIPTEGFHFGTELNNIVQSYPSQSVLYLGGASSPLMSSSEFCAISKLLQESSALVYANNAQSADIVGFTPASRLSELEHLPDNEKALAYDLRVSGMLPLQLMPDSVGIHFTIDTPSDMMVLKLLGNCSPRVQESLNHLPWNISTLEQFWALLNTPNLTPKVWISGRVGGPAMIRLNSTTQMRLRVVSEERGMSGSGRQHLVHSFVGSFIEANGIDGFLRYLEATSDVALIDTRPLFAHFKSSPSDNDRFYSDLLQWDRISDPWVRDFTQKASSAKIPIVLGGHTLVLGGIWAMTDALSQARRDRLSQS